MVIPLIDNTPAWLQAQVARADEAVACGQVEQACAVRADAAHYDSRKKLIVLELSNGSTFSFPPNLAQGLAQAQPTDLADIEVTPLGVGLHWPMLNADLTVEGLLLGMFGSRSWMRAHAAKAGSVKSAVKTRVAQANGAKGGRPRKVKPEHA
jgi:hypothetical protein